MLKAVHLRLSQLTIWHFQNKKRNSRFKIIAHSTSTAENKSSLLKSKG